MSTTAVFMGTQQYPLNSPSVGLPIVESRQVGHHMGILVIANFVLSITIINADVRKERASVKYANETHD